MSEGFRAVAERVSAWVGTPWFFVLNLALVVAWLVTGPLFRWGDTWQLVATTGLTVTTQLLVILIQATQNRDARVVHLKLDEILRAQTHARTALAGAEDMTEEKVEQEIESIKHSER